MHNSYQCFIDKNVILPYYLRIGTFLKINLKKSHLDVWIRVSLQKREANSAARK